MVRLLNVKISNLYSYDQTDTDAIGKDEPISFSNINVIVGPNDSGKSNIFRAIKLLVDSLKSNSTISDSTLYSNRGVPRLAAEFILSDGEAEILLDFLGVYGVPASSPNPQLLVYQFKNRKAILSVLKELLVEIRWQPSNYYLIPNRGFQF